MAVEVKVTLRLVGGDSEELSFVGSGPLLVGGDSVFFGDGHQDLVLQVREGGGEGVDRLLLAGAAAEGVVVDEVVGQQALAGGRVLLVDRLFVELADQGDVLFGCAHASKLLRSGPAVGNGWRGAVV